MGSVQICVCEIAAKVSARRAPKVRKGIIVQRLRDWIGVKATQLAQRKIKEYDEFQNCVDENVERGEGGRSFFAGTC